MISSQAKLVVLVSCLIALMPQRPSEALLLGNFIGCNSFGCRISALESDVAQLKLQMARMTDPHGLQNMQGMNNLRPNNQMLPYNQNGMNQQNQQGGQQGNQQGNGANNGNNGNNNNNGQQGGGNNQVQALAADGSQRVNYNSLDYPMTNQNLRRISGYQNSMNNGQYGMGM